MSSKSPSRSRSKAAAKAAPPSGGTGIEFLDDNAWVTLIPLFAAGVVLTNGNDLGSLKDCAKWGAFAKSGNGAGGGISNFPWKFGLVLTGHVFNCAQKGTGFVNGFTRTLLAAFGGAAVMGWFGGNNLLSFSEEHLFLAAFAWWFISSQWTAKITDEIPSAIKNAFGDFNELCTVLFCTTATVKAFAPGAGHLGTLTAGTGIDINMGALVTGCVTAVAYEGFPLKSGFKVNVDPAAYSSLSAALITGLFICTNFGPLNDLVDKAVGLGCFKDRADFAFWANVLAWGYNKFDGASNEYVKMVFGEAIPLVQNVVNTVLGTN